MATTYDASLGSNKDWVRLLIGDNATPMVLTDEEIDGIIGEQTSTGKATKYFAAADALLIFYGTQKSGRRGVVDRQMGKLRLRFGEDVSAENAINKAAAELRTKGTFYLARANRKSMVLRSAGGAT